MAIAKMKKIKGFAMQQDREKLLQELQLLGCLEVTEPEEELSGPQQLGESESSLLEYKSLWQRIGAAIKTLDKYAYVKSGLFKNRNEVVLSDFFDEELPDRALKYVTMIENAEAKLLKLYAEESKKLSETAFLKLWLDIDVPLEVSDTRYANVFFGTIPANRSFDEFRDEIIMAAEYAEVYAAGADREQKGILLIFHKEFTEDVNAIMRKYAFNRVSFKDCEGTAKENHDRISSELDSLHSEIEKTLEKLEELGAVRDDIKLYYDRVSQKISVEEAKEKLVFTNTAFAFQGWVPEKQLSCVEKTLDKYGCAYELTDPDKDDTVPIKLINNPVTEPLTMVTEMYGLPSYDGVDPNPLIMPFFVLFFGIMYNDLGYGLVMILISLIVKSKLKLRGTIKYLMDLMLLCGISSGFVGIFTGSFFGDAIPTVAGMYGHQITLPNLFSPLEEPLLVLIGALILGGIQIFVGMAINAYMLIRDGRPLDALFDVGSWWLLFAGIAVLAMGGTYWIAVAGVAALVLTQGRSKPTLMGKFIGGLASLYDITGYFGDILSYSRLMALMLASGVIATVVNMLGALPGNIIFYILIFLIGHAFNMGINIIGTYVHAARLQYLEYFGKFYRDGGKPFKPLSLKTKYVDVIKEEN